jgi:FtsH-binding integral membrane protein
MSQPTQVDPRGLRVAAGITAVVLAAVLAIPSEPVRIALLALQVLVFAIAALIGLSASPYAVVYAKAVRPRLAPPAELEDSRPPRFAQVVGLAFTVVALVALLAGATTVALVAAGLALVAALLNAVVGLCLGCELYLVLRRLAPAGT